MVIEVEIETLSIIGTDEKIEVEFAATPLGVLELSETGAVTMATSHDFKGVDNKRINFTSFDEITVVPLGEDANARCLNNACGLKFKLTVKTGNGRYNCGEIVSGYNTDVTATIPFTSFVDPSRSIGADGDTVVLNSVGKLCNCRGN